MFKLSQYRPGVLTVGINTLFWIGKHVNENGHNICADIFIELITRYKEWS